MKKSKKQKRSGNPEKEFKFRIIPHQNHVFFLAEDVCALFGLDRRRALDLLPEADRPLVEAENISRPGQKHPIVSVRGFFILIRHYRLMHGIGVAEYIKTALIPDAAQRVTLDPATITEFDAEFEGLLKVDFSPIPAQAASKRHF